MTKSVELTDKLRRLIFINSLISVIASSMLSTALVTALPAVIRDFQIPVTTGQWISSGYTLTTPEPVPYSWLTGYNLGLDSDFETAAKQVTGKVDATGRAMSVWQDYVTGTDPTNPDDTFYAMIAISNGMPCVTWTPNLNTNGEVRVYTVLGKTNLTDAAWVCPTNSAHRFFKVKVEMP